MSQKDRLILLEFVCVFSLVIFTLALFGSAISGYNLFIIAGLLGGFTFSWLNRDAPGPWPKILVTFGTVAIFGWMVYSVINSSLFYKEVILLCIKAALLLEVVLSFNATASLLGQMEALSVPICMGFPIFAAPPGGPSALFVLGYFLSWGILLRVKFYAAFTRQGQACSSRDKANFLIAAFFISVALTACALYYSIPLAALKARGIFRDKGKAGIDIGPDELEKEYYRLQEKLHKMLVDQHIPSLTTSEERHDALKFLESLLRELPDTFEVDQAEQGLFSQFKAPGPGSEPGEGEEVTLLKNYVQKKSELNIQRLKENVLDVFKAIPLDIKSRLLVLERANKAQGAFSYSQIRENSEQLDQIAEGSSLDKNMKGQARALTRQLRSWKDFELFLRQKEELKEKIARPENRKTQGTISELVAAIAKARSLAEFKELKNKIAALKQDAPSEMRGVTEKLEEMLYAKLEMILARVGAYLKKAIEQANLAGESLLAFEENLDTIAAAESLRELRQGYEQAQGRARAEKIKVFAENKELAGIKAALLAKEKKEKISGALEPDTPRELRDKFFQELEISEGYQEDASVSASFASQREYLDQFFNLGFVAAKGHRALTEALGQLEELLIFQRQLERENAPEEKQAQQELLKEETPAEGQRQPEEAARKEKKLLLIKIMPEGLKLALGQERQFVALGTYTDNSQEELTPLCDWASSNDKIIGILAGKISALGVGRADINAKYQGVLSESVTVVVEQAQLTAISIPFKKIKLAWRGKFALKADGYYSDLSHRDLTSLVDWKALPGEIVKIEGGKLVGLKFGKTAISAAYQGIESPALGAQVVLTLGVLLFMIFKWLLSLLLGATFLLLIFFILTWEEKKRMLKLYRRDPQGFILLLYRNAVEVLSLFESKRKGFIPPLSLAKEVEEKFGLKDNLFTRFSAKYAEAKYSRHPISMEDARLALSDYHGFLKHIFKASGFLKSASKRLLALLLRRPFFLH